MADLPTALTVYHRSHRRSATSIANCSHSSGVANLATRSSIFFTEQNAPIWLSAILSNHFAVKLDGRITLRAINSYDLSHMSTPTPVARPRDVGRLPAKAAAVFSTRHPATPGSIEASPFQFLHGRGQFPCSRKGDISDSR